MLHDPVSPLDTKGATPAEPAAPNLRTQILSLEGLENAGLRKAWKQAWKRPAPKGARGGFLMLGIAWKWQADMLGGFGPELSRRVSALETRGPIGKGEAMSAILDAANGARPMPGTRLLRDWRGERFEVHVTEQGYLWRGKTYGSLSAIARTITGVSQNGPRFFGLRDRRRARQ